MMVVIIIISIPVFQKGTNDEILHESPALD